MSPLALRRYRAERLLRRDFDALRSGVLAGARRRLATLQVRLDETDLEACYAQAWQGLYATVLAGQPVATPAAWLVTVTVRRAIDEHRQCGQAVPAARDPDGWRRCGRGRRHGSRRPARRPHAPARGVRGAPRPAVAA